MLTSAFVFGFGWLEYIDKSMPMGVSGTLELGMFTHKNSRFGRG
jgi:hypothetical protein